MPPLKISGLASLGTLNLCLRPALRQSPLPFLPLTHTATVMTKWEKKQLAKRDPYRWAQMQQRKNANLQRRAELQQIRDKEWGDPIWGIPTPFTESFNSAGQAGQSEVATDADGKPVMEPKPLPMSPHLLNNLLTREEVDEALQLAYKLSKPLSNPNQATVDPIKEQEELRKHEENHARASEAIYRIVSLQNASSKMRLHTNIRRCIEEFGRHNTDKVLRPKPRSTTEHEVIEMPGRCGPDTGSSEVQISILTAKIHKLAQELGQNRGHKDKHNKRNLRLLCHRRQKLLKYMERKERGSERWTNMLEKLGLSPATWKEQISF